MVTVAQLKAAVKTAKDKLDRQQAAVDATAGLIAILEQQLDLMERAIDKTPKK